MIWGGGGHAYAENSGARIHRFTAKEPTEIKDSNSQSIVREFLLNTSAHALLGIAWSSSVHNRVFWSVCFVVFTGIMICFLAKAKFCSTPGFQSRTTLTFPKNGHNTFSHSPFVTLWDFVQINLVDLFAECTNAVNLPHRMIVPLVRR